MLRFCTFFYIIVVLLHYDVAMSYGVRRVGVWDCPLPGLHSCAGVALWPLRSKGGDGGRSVCPRGGGVVT